jgi:hypothetical protein
VRWASPEAASCAHGSPVLLGPGNDLESPAQASRISHAALVLWNDLAVHLKNFESIFLLQLGLKP